MIFFISVRISLELVPNGPIANKLALVQVMADQATSQYLNQCWPCSPTYINTEMEQLVEDMDLFIADSQYHSRWWLGDVRSQVIHSGL